MTLKAFAESNGIGYSLAKQWKARGKIVTEGDGYRLVTEPRAVTGLQAVTNGDSVTEGDGGETVTALQSDVVTLRVTVAALQSDIASLVAENTELRDRIAAQDKAFWSTLEAQSDASERISDELAELRGRITALESAAAVTKQYSRSTYTGPRSDLGEPYYD